MCGISAIVAFDDAGRGVAARDVLRMHAPVAHRGPDGEGFLAVGCDLAARRATTDKGMLATGVPARAALAFRWLVVQDPSPEAAQPMSSADGRLWLLHNGEIYNDPELRRELGAESFRTKSDAEVILAAYRRWGTRCFERFNGMWALVLVDLDRRELVISRDRFGIRPLFYTEDTGRILLASEIKQILPLLPRTRPNLHYLHDYLEEGTLMHFDQGTFFEGVRTVPPATFARIDLDGPQKPLRFEPYWDAAAFQSGHSTARSFDAAAGDFSELLRSAVDLTLRTSARTGSFLSGGLDSSVVSALASSKKGAGEIETYSIVFDRSQYAAFDESPYIDDFVRMHRASNSRATIDAAWMEAMLGEVTWTHEEPLVASAQMAQYRAFQLARERGARVVLDGQGSDEVLSGYAAHEWLAWRNRLAKGRLLSGYREMKILQRKLGMSLRGVVATQILGPAVAVTRRALRGERRRYRFVRREAFADLARARADERLLARDRGPGRSSIEREVYRDLKYIRLRPILNNGDRNGMAHSMESRLPYLDHRLVEYALSMPPEFSVGFGERKRLLRHAAESLLPQSMLGRRDKMGFVTPEPLWLRRELLEAVRRAVAELRDSPFVSVAHARRFVDDYAAGAHSDFRAVWRLYALPAWLRRFGV